MAVSQNGYSANDRAVVTTYVVTAGGRKMALRVGSAGAMLAHFVRWFDEHIRDVDPGELDEWGYAERPIRGETTELSNHASGTAADVDATKWPLGSEPEKYLSAAEIAKVRARLPFYQGCIRWGGDYTGRKDPMHFEINRDQATVDRVWSQIQQSEEDDMSPAESQMLKDIKAEVMAGRRQDYVVLSGQVARILAAVQAGPGADVDEKALAAALAPAVIQALGDAKGLTAEDVEAAVSKVLARAAAG